MSGKYIVVVECANGNASVGTEWIETKVFDSNSTLKEVIDWADRKNELEGRVLLTKADE